MSYATTFLAQPTTAEERLATALATRRGETGRRFGPKPLTWDSAAGRIENVYRGLV